MKKQNQLKLSEAILYFIKENGMEDRVMQSQAIDAWNEQMGDFMKQYTEKIYAKDQILYVKLNSPLIKNELQYGKSKIIKHIHEFMKNSYIQDITFI